MLLAERVSPWTRRSCTSASEFVLTAIGEVAVVVVGPRAAKVVEVVVEVVVEMMTVVRFTF
jgi:hypothetical protein